MVNLAIQSELTYAAVSKIISFPTSESDQILYTSVLEMTSVDSEEDLEQSEKPIRYGTVRLSDLHQTELRLDAEFNIASKFCETEDLENSELETKPLYGKDGFCKEAFCTSRFKRIYVENGEHGVPLLSSSEITDFRPAINQYLSRKNTPDLDKLMIQKWDILISRSGTVGDVGLATDYFTGKAASENIICLRVNDAETAGYITAFLRSRYGRPQLTQATYGSVIVHIEPQHLERVLIPDLPPIRRITIGRLMCKAGELRNEANRLLDEADCLLHERLNLPYLKDIIPNRNVSAIAKIKASQLMGRLEGSFHDPVAIAAEKQLAELSVEVTTVGDSRVTKEVRAITKFRKRTYVEKGGIPLLSSKQLFQVDPVNVKRLAKGAHTKDLPEIQLEENMIAVTCSGTIGRVQIIPKYMATWTANQHATRFIASEDINAGYLYAWLASDYGYCLITRHSYGSVILEVDKEMFSSVPILIPEVGIRNEIGNLVLQANQLRDEAWRNEQDAITRLENLITNKPTVPEQEELNPNKIDLTKIKYDPNAVPIWELAARISAKVPDEEWAKVPSDLSQRFDYYQGLRDDS